MFVRGSKRRVVPSLGEDLGQGVSVECARIGEALTAVAYNPHPPALRLGRGERLDLTLVRPNLDLAFVDHHRLDLFSVGRPACDPGGDGE